MEPFVQFRFAFRQWTRGLSLVMLGLGLAYCATMRGTLGMIELRFMGTESEAFGMISPMTTLSRTRVVSGSKGDLRWTEVWTIERIGIDAEYIIHFSPSQQPGGGIHYEIMLPSEPAS